MSLIDLYKVMKLLIKNVDLWELMIEWSDLITKDIAKFGLIKISLTIIHHMVEEDLCQQE